MKVRYGRRAVLLADRNQQTVACKKKNKQTQLAKRKKKALKPNNVNLQIVHMLKNIDLLLPVEPGPLLENMQTLENIDLLSTLLHPVSLSSGF